MISLCLSPTIVLSIVQELLSEVKTKTAKSYFQRQHKHFFSFSEVVSQDLPGWTESEWKDGIVRWERLYTMWWLVIHVAVSRVWALGLSSEALVHAIILLTPPRRLVSPACGVTANEKALFPLCDGQDIETGHKCSEGSFVYQHFKKALAGRDVQFYLIAGVDFNLLRLYSP